MIDLQDLRDNADAYRKAADNKNIGAKKVDALLAADAKRRELVPQVEEMRAKKNEVSKQIPTLKDKEKDKAMADMKKLKADQEKVEKQLTDIEVEWKALQLEMPSLPLDSVPVGKDEDGNKENRAEGSPTEFSFEPKDHVTLGQELDLFDIERGVKIAGSRSYFLKGDGARLHLAVMQLALNHLVAKGWTPFFPPLMANWDCLMGTGFFPGAEEQTYAVGADRKRGDIESDDLYLIGTSEVSVASYHKDEVLKEADLPTRYCGYSSCFRREAGTYGKDTHGLYRIHQFQKVEQVVLCRPDQDHALEMFEEIRNNAEEVLKLLELPYRVIDVCTGDMGKGKVFMQDIETWMPSRESYGETHSCSYLGSFQARRLNIKYETSDGKKEFVHTLNNTCIASPRILIPILEIYQNEDGTIRIPDALQPYMGGQKTIEKR